MALRRTHRVPVVLLSLLVATLVFPGAFDGLRLAVGSWLPATTRPERAPAVPLAAEERARMQAEIDRLRDLLAAVPSGDSVLSGMRVRARRTSSAPVALPARVLHRDVSPYRRTFVIDVGRDEGVLPGQPVVQQDSLVGVVVTATAHAARVLRIDDRAAETTFPAVVLAADGGADAPARAMGVARGAGGDVRVALLPPGGAVPGDLVVTGAGSRLVPEGLVLGLVASFDDDDRDGEWEAQLRPLRDLDTVASVLVLLCQPTGLRVEAK